MNKATYFITNFLLSIFILSAQPKVELGMMLKKYPEQQAIFTNIHETISISLPDGVLKVNMKIENEIMLLDERAALYSEGNASYSSLVHLYNIEASTLYPGEKKYKEIRVNEFKEKDQLSGDIFHDDIKIKKFNFPSLVQGAKRKVVLNYDIKDPFMLTPFHFAEPIAAEKIQLTIICPDGVEMGYKIFNADSANIVFEKKKDSGKIIYTWKSENVKKIESEDNSPDELYYTPHIVFFIKSYKTNGAKEKVLESLDDLHNYYSKLIKNLNAIPNEQLKIVVDSLIKDAQTDDEKIKAIYYWVKDNIKYIAFESGYEGFIPRQSKDVFEKRFGDCKDMASIITDMLKYAGISSFLTWIGSRDIPYTYIENHTMSTDNHMIASVKQSDGKYIFLDATSAFTPYGYPASHIQGKEAMIHLSDSAYELVKVPIVDASKNVIFDSVYIDMTKDFTLTGTGIARYSGYERDNILNRLYDNNKEQKKTILRNYLQKGSNKFILEHFEEKNAYYRDEDFIVNYRFKLSDYVLKSGDEIFINLNLDKVYDRSSIDKNRKTDIEFRSKRRFEYTVSLKIPDNYEISHLPKNDTFKDENLSLSMNYIVKDNTVTLKSIVEFNYMLLQKKDFNKWNDFILRLKQNYTESVSLKKKA